MDSEESNTAVRIAAKIIVGPILIIVSVFCLWANEGRFDYHSAAVKARVLVDIGSGQSSSAIAYTGALRPVSFAGDYVSRFENYLTVERVAEIYCWKRRKSDGVTHWSRGWSSRVRSNSRNRGLIQELSDRQLKAESYQVAGLDISPQDLHFADDRETLSPNSFILSSEGKSVGLRPYQRYLYYRKHQGDDDVIGDERLRYVAVPAADIATYFGSIPDQVGEAKVFVKKSGMISNLIKDNGILHHVVNGDRDAALRTLKRDIRRLRWTVRGGGILGCIVGIFLALEPLIHLVMGIPLLGRLVHGGVLIVSIVLGLLLSLATITVAWLVHHPGIAILAVSVVLGLGVWLLAWRKRASANASVVLNRLENAQFSVSPGSRETLINRPEHVFQHLVKIAVSDGQFDKTENAFLANWARERHFPDKRIESLFDDAKTDRGIHPVEATREDLYYLISLSLADGHLCTSELKRLQRFACDLDIDDKELGSLIGVVRRGQVAHIHGA